MTLSRDTPKMRGKCKLWIHSFDTKIKDKKRHGGEMVFSEVPHWGRLGENKGPWGYWEEKAPTLWAGIKACRVGAKLTKSKRSEVWARSLSSSTNYVIECELP